MENDGLSSGTDQQTKIDSFLEIALDQTADTARRFLQATEWKLEEALQLFYIGNEVLKLDSQSSRVAENHMAFENVLEDIEDDENVIEDDEYENNIEDDGSEVRAPLPVRRDTLYGTHYRPHVELRHPEVWEGDQGSTSTAEASKENLASLYRPPFALMYHGTFEMAKDAAKHQDRWLLVNVQSTKEFSSHMLNRDTWGNETVAQTIASNFIFWQIYDDTEEGCKINTYYKLDSLPVTFVIDPITGQKMKLWRGVIEPESFLEDVLQFTDRSPKDHLYSLTHKRAMPPKIQDEIYDDDEMKAALELSMQTKKENNEWLSNECDVKEKYDYPPLPEEPKGDKSLLCRVGFRLPDGSRIQRNFLRSDPIQLLWSFCAAKCGDERGFRLTQAIPGAVKHMDYEKMLTFEESGVANSMISVTWE
ncbi:plant UBX domain-containing protein 7-like [Bidens hawaiensis]|uniref:plant UBX domain-containing protein 7-like n=1 Tax=Bidens hawaiensis TaxID=980011 RepID=UPI00404A3C04